MKPSDIPNYELLDDPRAVGTFRTVHPAPES
jgi:hypothetical protein